MLVPFILVRTDFQNISFNSLYEKVLRSLFLRCFNLITYHILLSSHKPLSSSVRILLYKNICRFWYIFLGMLCYCGLRNLWVDMERKTECAHSYHNLPNTKKNDYSLEDMYFFILSFWLLYLLCYWVLTYII